MNLLKEQSHRAPIYLLCYAYYARLMLPHAIPIFAIKLAFCWQNLIVIG